MVAFAAMTICFGCFAAMGGAFRAYGRLIRHEPNEDGAPFIMVSGVLLFVAAIALMFLAVEGIPRL